MDTGNACRLSTGSKKVLSVWGPWGPRPFPYWLLTVCFKSAMRFSSYGMRHVAHTDTSKHDIFKRSCAVKYMYCICEYASTCNLSHYNVYPMYIAFSCSASSARLKLPSMHARVRVRVRERLTRVCACVRACVCVILFSSQFLLPRCSSVASALGLIHKRVL